MSIARRPVTLVGLVALLGLLVALPALGADPSASPTPPGQEKEKPARPEHAKGPKAEITVRGTIQKGADEKGRPTFTLTAGGTTWELSAGPKWYWGDKSPLDEWVGESVEVKGWRRGDATDISVETIDGERVRAEGKPPWAGGPWVLGEGHPGWKTWKTDGHPGRGHGLEHAPGQSSD